MTIPQIVFVGTLVTLSVGFTTVLYPGVKRSSGVTQDSIIATACASTLMATVAAMAAASITHALVSWF